MVFVVFCLSFEVYLPLKWFALCNVRCRTGMLIVHPNPVKIPRIVLFWTHARLFVSLYSDIYSAYWPFIALVLLMYSYDHKHSHLLQGYSPHLERNDARRTNLTH